MICYCGILSSDGFSVKNEFFYSFEKLIRGVVHILYSFIVVLLKIVSLEYILKLEYLPDHLFPRVLYVKKFFV